MDVKYIDAYIPEINWMERYANPPALKLTVPQSTFDMLKTDTPIWHRDPESGRAWAEYAGLMAHLHLPMGIIERRPVMGFGGARFDVAMADGTTWSTNNAWCGGAESYERFLGAPLLDISIRAFDTGSTYSFGYGIRVADAYAIIADHLSIRQADHFFDENELTKPSEAA